MSDERPAPDDWLTEDPFANPEDPAARERAERRAEREQKRREKAAKEAGEPPPPPPEQAAAEPPKPKRTPEQEFWDEEPTPAPAPAAPAAGAAASAAKEGEGAPAGDPPAPAGEKRRRRFRREKPEVEPAPPAEAAPPTAERIAEEQTRPAGNARRAKGSPTAKSEPTANPEPTAKSESPTGKPEAPTAKPEPGPSPPKPESSPPKSASPPPPNPEPTPSKSEPPTPVPMPPPPAGTSEPSTTVQPIPEPSNPNPGSNPAPEPVPIPVGADPTRPATGEHLVPDPQAPSARGQTSEEWAAVPAARANALDDELHDEGDPTMTGAARAGRRRGDDGGNRRRGIIGALARHPFRIAAVVILIVVLWFLNGLFQPFHGDGHGKVAVRIPKGASASEIADILEKRGVITGPGLVDASTLFQVRVLLGGKRSDLHSGRFVLQKDMSYADAMDVLSSEEKAAAKPGIGEVLIPPALSRPQVAELMKEDGIPGNYMKASKQSKLLDPAEYGGKQAKSLEGFLFPDTYEVRKKEGVEGVVRRQVEAFKKNIKKVNMKYAKSKNLTIYDVVTIASMIEGEAAVPKERKLVASVIYNRLHEGMPLQIDATVRFATGNHQRPLSESELASDSPYNTYANSGLPAGPINSPGLDSLNAAAHPARTDYLFYVVNPKGCNEHSFSASEEEFLADVDKYEKAREANGGNAPSTCG